jgi:negative regulator of replication initiation
MRLRFALGPLLGVLLASPLVCSAAAANKKKEVFTQMVKHMKEIVQSAEVAEAFSPVERSLVNAALAVLVQGEQKEGAK